MKGKELIDLIKEAEVEDKDVNIPSPISVEDQKVIVATTVDSDIVTLLPFIDLAKY